MDTVLLQGLRAVGIHGVLPHERERAQPFEVDLEVEVDLAAAAERDELSETVDYGALAEQVASIVSSERYGLLERLAGRIADEVLADARVHAVTVTVRKLRPPVPVQLESAGVRLRRERR